ncbi:MULTISPECIES: hypothetical protein [unclassified Exiguobacterium]|uniref:hypothetical protein n=2 Tax=Exiguobacterium TaxID=33986 RepID=UPI001BEA6A42|nr:MULTISPECIES: hypothetical protein [unclassified Exiguobacterium]
MSIWIPVVSALVTGIISFGVTFYKSRLDFKNEIAKKDLERKESEKNQEEYHKKEIKQIQIAHQQELLLLETKYKHEKEISEQQHQRDIEKMKAQIEGQLQLEEGQYQNNLTAELLMQMVTSPDSNAMTKKLNQLERLGKIAESKSNSQRRKKRR